MIRYIKGNLLKAPAEALVNTVNELGVMGRGVALMFREAFPESAGAYQKAAKRGDIHVGRVLVIRSEALFGPRWIIHFPTKKHWDGRDPRVRATAEHESASGARSTRKVDPRC